MNEQGLDHSFQWSVRNPIRAGCHSAPSSGHMWATEEDALAK